MKKFTTLAASLLLGAMSMQAVPAYRGAIKAKQPDGTTITLYMQGDEYSHKCVSVDGYQLIQDAKGAYRYASLNSDNTLTCANSPIAHNPIDRKASETKYVGTLTLAKDMPNANTTKYKICKSPSQRKIGMGTMSRYQVGNYPTIGEGKCLVLLVQFSDVKFTYDNDYHSRMLNEEGFSDNGATGSARDYYIAQSGGKFKPTFDVVGPITLTRSERYYGQDDVIQGKDVNVSKMISEACKLAKEKYNVDFSQYDGDNDGKVDMVYVIFAGYGQHAGGGDNTIWPHKYQLTSFGERLTLDDKLIDTYACSSELFGNTGAVSSGIGTLCHEFGHVLGLCDHYDTTDATNYQLGRYDIMDYGPYNNDGNTPPSYNAFERTTLGWMTPDEIDERTAGVTLENIATSNKAYMIKTSNPDEFYLLENRQQTGWDSYIMSCGLMITHVDFNEKTWLNNTLNTDSSHPHFYLVEADNEKGYDVLLEKETEKGDLFPYGTHDSFTDNTIPAAKPYTGETLNKWVTNIENKDGIVSFNFMANHLAKPEGLKIENAGGMNFCASWNDDEEAMSYDVMLKRLEYKSEQQFADRENFDRMTAGTDAIADRTAIDNQLDDYMDTKGYTGNNVYQAGGWCQIGKEGQGGSLTTPTFNMKRYNGEYAVAITVKAPTGKQPVLSVSSNGQTGKTRINSVVRTYLFKFKGGISKTDITISTNSERALIDRIDICRGDAKDIATEAKEVAVSGVPTQTEGDVEDNEFVTAETKTFENVGNYKYTFENLLPNTFYAVAVKANGDNGSSKYSDDLVFNTAEVTAIKNVETNTYQGDKAIFSIDGIRTNSLDRPGVYIIKENGKTRKIIVR